METNYREEQHKRIVAISVAAIIFGLAAILRLSASVFAGVEFFDLAGRGDEIYLLSACILMVCTVSVILARSIQDNRQGRHEERHDRLTGLPNRNHLLQQLGKNNRSAPNAGTLMLINPGRVGSINVSMGREAGDEVMKACAERLQYLFPSPHLTGVCAPGVFAVYIEGVTGASAICDISKKVDEALSIPVKVNERAVFLSKSTGAAVHLADSDMPEVSLRRAELALLEAKTTESRAPVIFNQSLEDLHSRQGSLETDFLETIEQDKLETWLQPLVAPDGKTLLGFEALARWIHPERGMISPGVFIPIAEKMNLTDKLGRIILRKACNAVKPFEGVSVSVNVTATHLLQEDFVDQVQRVLAETGFPVERLELELTETVVLEATETAGKRIRDLRSMGVRIALDDFGTGYSGLSYLNRFEVDRVKIDASFVGEVGHSISARETIESVVTLARKRGCDITAEGVETEEQFEFLKRFGELTFQGFLFSRPIAPVDLARHGLVREFNLRQFELEAQSDHCDEGAGFPGIKTQLIAGE